MRSKRNKNDVNIEGFVFNKATNRFKSFLATYRDPETGKIVRKRISFEKTINKIEEAREEKIHILRNLDAITRVSIERLQYMEKLKKWEKMADEFHKWKVQRANKSTADNNKSNLLNWVFRYFLKEEREYNYKNWARKYEDFQTWLAYQKSERANTKQGDGSLTINSQNNAIRGLNAFLEYLESKTGEPLIRCTVKESPEVKGPECIIDDELELPVLLRKLEAVTPGFEEFAFVLRYTGLRSMECRGLHLDSCVFTSLNKDKEYVEKLLKGAGFSLYGYIDLKSQLVTDSPSGPFTHGKLKHRPSMDDKYARYIPLLEKKLADILHKRFKAARQRFLDDEQAGEAKTRDQYLLFPEVTYAKFLAAMEGLYSGKLGLSENSKGNELSKFHPKRPHDFRHTFVTWIMGKFGGEPNLSLARDVWGHADYKTVQRYTQLLQKIKKEEVKQKQLENAEDIEIKAL